MSVLLHEKIWVDKTAYSDAEKNYYESLSKVSITSFLNVLNVPAFKSKVLK